MARCLRPITIRDPRISDAPHFLAIEKVGKRYARQNLRPRVSGVLVVPCGKCLACLKNKQSAMVVRCKREAEKRGTFAFMTLTYDDEHLPIMESMFRVNLRTSEEVLVEKPEFMSTGYHPEKAYTDLFKTVPGTPLPRYRVFEHCTLGEFQFQIRVTPSVCRSDVRNWIKMARIQYKRDTGSVFPAFSYVAIGEYGPRTCRPHYHLAFFGLQREHLYYLLDRWRFGKVKQVRMVMQVNRDGSNGFLKASKYIGKYMSKGKFECQSVSCGAAEKPRVCQSIGLGTKDLEPIKKFVLCEDIVGSSYDPVSLTVSGVPISSQVVEKLIEEIPKRLVYRVDERTVLPLPRIIRDKIFKFEDDEYKEKKVSTPLWAMVADALRDKYARESDERFEQFCSCHPERTASENMVAFADWQEFNATLEEEIMSKDFKSFYSKSKF